MVLYFLLLLAALLVPDIYLWRTYVEPAGSLPLSVLWFLPSAAAVVSYILVRKGVLHNTFLRIFFGIILVFALPKIIFSLLQFVVGPWVALAAASAVILLFVYGFFFGWRRIVVRTADCRSELLPVSFDGYRILQFSDLHVGTFRGNPSFVKKLVRVINAQHPDLIVFTGDLVNIRADEVRPFLEDLAKLKSTDGVYSIMGNHDYCEYAQDHSEQFQHRNQHILQYYEEEKMGWKMLMNDHVTISRLRKDGEMLKSESIALIGVENISKPPFPDYGNLKKAMEGLPQGMFKVLLSHDPSHWRRGVLHETDIALTLSGHTHAGQLKIGRFSPSKWAYNEWGGKYTEGKSMLYVSLGLGGTVPFRFGAWPEVNVITLKKL